MARARKARRIPEWMIGVAVTLVVLVMGFMRPSFLETFEYQQVKERFFREAQAAGGLNHPNILTIYDSGEEMDVAWIAMEYLSGKAENPASRFQAVAESPKE